MGPAMSIQYLIVFLFLLALVLALWHYTKRHPLVVLVAACGLALALRWFGAHPFLTTAGVAVAFIYWRSERVRSFTRQAGELATIGWWYLSGIPDELRNTTNRLRRLQLRILRRIRSQCRVGVFGEKQLPTTALIEAHPYDYQLLAEMPDHIRQELEEHLRHRSSGYRIMGAPRVAIRSEPSAPRGWPRVRVTFSPETVYDESVHPQPTRVNVESKLLRVDAPGEVLVSERIVLGRDVKQATIVIDDDPFVSRVHAIIDYDGEGHYVDDGGSMNGTFVNGIEIHGRHPLRHGDKLRLGRTVTWEFIDSSENTTAVGKTRLTDWRKRRD